MGSSFNCPLRAETDRKEKGNATLLTTLLSVCQSRQPPGARPRQTHESGIGIEQRYENAWVMY